MLEGGLNNQERRLNHLLKLRKAPKKTSLIFLQGLPSAVNRIVSDSELKTLLIETLAFKMSVQNAKG